MLKSLVLKFGEVEDPRVSWKSGHLLVDILAISVCAVLAHAESFEDIWGVLYFTYR